VLPQFLAHVCCGQKAGWIKMLVGTEVGLGPGHVLDGDPASSCRSKNGAQPRSPLPQFSAHVCCDPTAGWVRMPICTKVGLGPGDFVLDGGSKQDKGFPYSIPSIGPGADPDVHAVSPQVIHPAVGCHYFPPGLRLPPQPQSITAFWQILSSTAW